MTKQTTVATRKTVECREGSPLGVHRMVMPRLLDLYCCAGGAAMGYRRAGFEIVGVDHEPQPNYPFQFVQADAVEYAIEHGREFDAIHASPPCQAHTKIALLGEARNGQYPKHEDDIDRCREALIAIGKPYVIENVIGAPMRGIRLCGAMFGLKTYRHRLFESSEFLWVPEHPRHVEKVPPAGNGMSENGWISICGTGGVRGMTADEIVSVWSDAIGIDWMNRRELAQAVPPAYTEYIGRQLRERAIVSA